MKLPPYNQRRLELVRIFLNDVREEELTKQQRYELEQLKSKLSNLIEKLDSEEGK